MKVDNDDIQLIREIHRQYHLTADEKLKTGLRYVLKDVIGRYLLQVKHYEPYVSEEAEKRITEELIPDFPGIKISQIKLHDCNVINPVSLSGKQRKLFANKNSYKKLFHLEHDPPTLQVVRSILDTKSITDEEIRDKLEHCRLCFITVKENDLLDAKEWHSERPSNAYEQLGFNAKKAV
jgi:hypothetical protein